MPDVLDRRATAGQRRHPVTLQGPGAPVPDGDGGYTYTYGDLTPARVWATISPATAADLERLGGGTVLAQATHVLRLPYHRGVTTETRVLFGSRIFSVIGVANPGERNLETVVLAMEIVP
jgi:head-tail adaptor